MMDVDFNLVSSKVTEINGMKKQLRPNPIRFYPYLKRVLEEDRDAGMPEFPMRVNLAKPNKYLLKNDFEPLYTIVLDNPVTMPDGTPMWFNGTEGGMCFRFGYEDCDARKISKVRCDMEYIHSFLGGSSGHGKSVTLNSMIGALCHEYAPWELEMHLSDAKIIEFKKYGVNHRIPHIATIAATEDAEFVRSVLERAFQEMNERAKIFGNIGASNLKSFRKQTGLALPRVLIVMDEVESTFKLAGKHSGRIADLIDGFARLGRAAGYHVFMATQNMSADIPSSAIGQIRNRFCLGANQKTSESVLGNAGATYNVGKIGRMIVNTEVLNGGDTTPFNHEYQTPLIEDDEFEGEMKFLEEKGIEVGFKRKMAFYDENDMKTVEQFDKLVSKAMTRMQEAHETDIATPVCLGYPAFVTDDEDEMFKIWLDHKDVENILVSSGNAERAVAHLHNITKSLSAADYAIQLFTTELDLSKFVFNPMVVSEARSVEQPPLSTLASLVRKRLFLMQIEQQAQNARFNREAVEASFEKDKLPREAYTALMYQRAVVFNNLINSKEWEDVRYLFPNFLPVYNEYVKCNCLIRKMVPSDFKRAAFVVGDLAKIVGYGRDTKTKSVVNLKKTLQDASRVNVIFVLFTRSMEGLTDLVSGIRYSIFDAPDVKDYGRMRTEEPASLSSNLALLYDNMNNDNPQRKFKRTLLREEV